MNTYLLEIGLEELPAQVILPAVQQLADKVKATCEQNQLTYDSLKTYSSPRRLTVLITGLPEKQNDQILELKGPPIHIAKDADGNWSKAAEGFAKKNQIAVADLFVQEFKGKEFMFARKEMIGKPTRLVFEENAKEWITSISFPKNMRWGQYRMRYARPIRWLISLWNDQVLPIEMEMVSASSQLHGHRFMHSQPEDLTHAEHYLESMEALHVIADYEKRRAIIVEQVHALEKQHDFQVVLDEDLLQEVANLVEWPTALMGAFEKEFLDLPAEVLVTSMAKHQRYFPVYDKTGNILPHFITVRNGDDRSAEQVVQGNEKVIRARLSDARFFFLEDQKHLYSFYHDRAAKVVFFKDRGSVAQRAQRIHTLSLLLAEPLKLSGEQLSTVSRIAELCKFDLQTQLVNEFPALQGVMGECYAKLKGETELVSRGIREHYHPRFAQDTISADIEVLLVALADKLDMLATAFSLNIIPSGSADPYALRRTAQGIVQILLDAKLPFAIDSLNQHALEVLDKQQNLDLPIIELIEKLKQFFELRQRFFMQEAGIRYDLIDALLQGDHLVPIQQVQFAELLKEHLETPPFKRAVEAIVRASNIARKQADSVPEALIEDVLVENEEKTLWELVQSLKTETLDLTNYCQNLFELEPAITAFFDKVMVMDENIDKRKNRLWLCHTIAHWSANYLDLSKIVFPKD